MSIVLAAFTPNPSAAHQRTKPSPLGTLKERRRETPYNSSMCCSLPITPPLPRSPISFGGPPAKGGKLYHLRHRTYCGRCMTSKHNSLPLSPRPQIHQKSTTTGDQLIITNIRFFKIHEKLFNSIPHNNGILPITINS